MKTTLTIPQANRLARGRAKVTVNPVDRRLWQVEGDGWVEAQSLLRQALQRLAEIPM
jgi:hypothetical protein